MLILYINQFMLFLISHRFILFLSKERISRQPYTKASRKISSKWMEKKPISPILYTLIIHFSILLTSPRLFYFHQKERISFSKQHSNQRKRFVQIKVKPFPLRIYVYILGSIRIWNAFLERERNGSGGGGKKEREWKFFMQFNACPGNSNVRKAGRRR